MTQEASTNNPMNADKQSDLQDEKESKNDAIGVIADKLLSAKNTNQKELDKVTRERLPDIILQWYDYKPKYKIDGKTGGITFYPSPHLKKSDYGTKTFKKEKFLNSKQLQHFLNKLKCNTVLAMNDMENLEIISKADNFHGFVRAMEIAYFEHYPLKIKVSHIWLLILHGLAQHLDVYHEKLRKKYVNHQGKKALIVKRANFLDIKSKYNDWESVIDEFAKQIDSNTNNNVASIVENNFTVSTRLEQIASKVSLMDACKHYFYYCMICGCGFPQITLDGNKQDWLKLKSKVLKLFEKKSGLMEEKFVLKWKESLIDILDRFISCYNGEIDCVFWNSMVRRGYIATGMSGHYSVSIHPSSKDSWYSGWICAFFPYQHTEQNGFGFGYGKDKVEKPEFRENCSSFSKYKLDDYFKPEQKKKNKNNDYDDDDDFYGYSSYGRVTNEDYTNDPLRKANLGGFCSYLETFPIGLTNAPVSYFDAGKGQSYQLKFAAGFIGVEQNDKTLEISPKIGWLVAKQ